MKFLFALLFLISSTGFAQALMPDGNSFIDAEGLRHGLGYKGRGSVHGAIFWTPKIRHMAPEAYDLRALGLSPKIKNQGGCGSCWAFSITSALEGANLKAGNSYVEVAPQQMVSCADASGCGGGYMENMSYVVDHGVAKEADWPYTARTGSCNKNPPIAVKGTKWGYCGSSSRKPTLDEVKQCLQDFGVLSAEVAAGGAFSPDSDGFINRCSSSPINHMVRIDGWLPGDYLILGNSWGSWGDKGYAYTKLGCNRYGNSVTWVQVAGAPSPHIPSVRLPKEIDVLPDTAVMIGVKAEAGIVYSWEEDGKPMAGANASMIMVTPEKDTVYKIKATTSAGMAESSVFVKVIQELE